MEALENWILNFSVSRNLILIKNFITNFVMANYYLEYP